MDHALFVPLDSCVTGLGSGAAKPAEDLAWQVGAAPPHPRWEGMPRPRLRVLNHTTTCVAWTGVVDHVRN